MPPPRKIIKKVGSVLRKFMTLLGTFVTVMGGDWVCVFTAAEAKAEASGPEVRIARAGWELSPSDWKAEALLPPTVKGNLGSSGAIHRGPGNVLVTKGGYRKTELSNQDGKQAQIGLSRKREISGSHY